MRKRTYRPGASPSLITGVLREELRAPAEHVGAEHGRHPVNYLGPADVIGEEGGVQVPVVVSDIGVSGLRVALVVNGCTPVHEPQPLAPPEPLHLLDLVHLEGPHIAELVEAGHLLLGRSKALLYRVRHVQSSQ
jgi:hypothetical protein